MNSFEVAHKFFEACESPLGWEGCKQYVHEDAPFIAQCEPLAEIDTIQGYCDWMAAFGTITSPEGFYDLHSSSYDENSSTAVFFASYHAKHTGEGGPVPPTQKESKTHYVYILKMSDDSKVSQMTKVWNAPWAMKELGWG